MVETDFILFCSALAYFSAYLLSSDLEVNNKYWKPKEIIFYVFDKKTLVRVTPAALELLAIFVGGFSIVFTYYKIKTLEKKIAGLNKIHAALYENTEIMLRYVDAFTDKTYQLPTFIESNKGYFMKFIHPHLNQTSGVMFADSDMHGQMVINNHYLYYAFGILVICICIMKLLSYFLDADFSVKISYELTKLTPEMDCFRPYFIFLHIGVALMTPILAYLAWIHHVLEGQHEIITRKVVHALEYNNHVHRLFAEETLGKVVYNAFGGDHSGRFDGQVLKAARHAVDSTRFHSTLKRKYENCVEWTKIMKEQYDLDEKARAILELKRKAARTRRSRKSPDPVWWNRKGPGTGKNPPGNKGGTKNNSDIYTNNDFENFNHKTDGVSSTYYDFNTFNLYDLKNLLIERLSAFSKLYVHNLFSILQFIKTKVLEFFEYFRYENLLDFHEFFYFGFVITFLFLCNLILRFFKGFQLKVLFLFPLKDVLYNLCIDIYIKNRIKFHFFSVSILFFLFLVLLV